MSTADKTIDPSSLKADEIRKMLVEDFGYSKKEADSITGKNALKKELQDCLTVKNIDINNFEEVEDSPYINVDNENNNGNKKDNVSLTPKDHGWNDYVLSHLKDDEKNNGMPTVDGLRRILEFVLDCEIMASESEIISAGFQSAVVKHTIFVVDRSRGIDFSVEKKFTGVADVYPGQGIDDKYLNYAVSLAETRAEGRALKRALKLRKVISAEEGGFESFGTSSTQGGAIIDDNLDEPENDKRPINKEEIDFIDILCKKANFSVVDFVNLVVPNVDNVNQLKLCDYTSITNALNKYIREESSNKDLDINNYSESWKSSEFAKN